MTQSVLFFYRLFVVLGIGIYTSLKALSSRRGILTVTNNQFILIAC